MGTSWRLIAPLQLCDVAVFIAVAALLSRRQLLFELTYFWGCAGTALALLTPDIAESFPHHRFVLFFAQHGAIVIVAIWMSLGLGMRPIRFGALRAWLLLNVYALVLGLFNAAAGTNFMYLCAKPGSATPLDLLGPWPWYLLGSELIALSLFALLTLPWRAVAPSTAVGDPPA